MWLNKNKFFWEDLIIDKINIDNYIKDSDESLKDIIKNAYVIIYGRNYNSKESKNFNQSVYLRSKISKGNKVVSRKKISHKKLWIVLG